MAKSSKPKPMTAATRRQLIAAFNDVLGALGWGTFDKLDEMVGKLAAGKPEKGVQAGVLLGLKTMTENAPEPTPQQLQEMLLKIKGLPLLMRAVLNTTLKQIKSELPRKPGGGRRSSLTEQQKEQVRDKIATLIRNRVPLKAAYIRVAQQFSVGTRTIQRAWQQRGTESDR